MLDNPAARDVLWPEVVVDFGHELITSVHTPIAWCRPLPHATSVSKFTASQRVTLQLRSVFTGTEGSEGFLGLWVCKLPQRTASTAHRASLQAFAELMRMGLQHLAQALRIVGKIALLVRAGAVTLLSCCLLAYIIWLKVWTLCDKCVAQRVRMQFQPQGFLERLST